MKCQAIYTQSPYYYGTIQCQSYWIRAKFEVATVSGTQMTDWWRLPTSSSKYLIPLAHDCILEGAVYSFFQTRVYYHSALLCSALLCPALLCSAINCVSDLLTAELYALIYALINARVTLNLESGASASVSYTLQCNPFKSYDHGVSFSSTIPTRRIARPSSTCALGHYAPPALCSRAVLFLYETTLANSEQSGTLCSAPGCGNPSNLTPFANRPHHVEPPK